MEGQQSGVVCLKLLGAIRECVTEVPMDHAKSNGVSLCPRG